MSRFYARGFFLVVGRAALGASTRIPRYSKFRLNVAQPSASGRFRATASRLKAVERYGDVLVLAQGKVVEKPVDAGLPQFTWEEFSAMYDARVISSE